MCGSSSADKKQAAAAEDQARTTREQAEFERRRLQQQTFGAQMNTETALRRQQAQEQVADLVENAKQKGAVETDLSATDSDLSDQTDSAGVRIRKRNLYTQKRDSFAGVNI